MNFVHLEGDGFLTSDGRFYSEARVRTVLRHIADWWESLSDDERHVMSELSYWAALDRDLDAAVNGEQP